MLTKAQRLLYSIIKLNEGVEDKTKLAKLQYFADFIHYAFNDKPISDESCSVYTRQKQGPLPRSLTEDVNILKNLGYIEENPKYNYKIKENINIDLDDDEFKTIKYVINKYGKHSWKELVDISHNQEPYFSALDGQIIEFFTAYNLIDYYTDYNDFN